MPAISRTWAPIWTLRPSRVDKPACVTMRLASHSLRPAGRSLNLASFDVVARSTIDPLRSVYGDRSDRGGTNVDSDY